MLLKNIIKHIKNKKTNFCSCGRRLINIPMVGVICDGEIEENKRSKCNENNR